MLFKVYEYFATTLSENLNLASCLHIRFAYYRKSFRNDMYFDSKRAKTKWFAMSVIRVNMSLNLNHVDEIG